MKGGELAVIITSVIVVAGLGYAALTGKSVEQYNADVRAHNEYENLKRGTRLMGNPFKGGKHTKRKHIINKSRKNK